MTVSSTVWAVQVAAVTDLPDERLQTRLATILRDTIEHPSASIPQATGTWGQAKATYRFYANPRVTADTLHRGFAADTARRCLDQDVVLVVQDTTTLNLTGLRSIAELGPIDSGGLARGVHVHTALAVTASGRVIGILDQQYWARPLRGQPGPEEKESGKWINGIDASRAALYGVAGDGALPRLIHVMDREGDAYEVMMAVVDAGDGAIIRCAQHRRIDDPLAKAHQAVRSQPVLCRTAVEVSRKAGVPQRHAQVEVRSMPVTLVPDLQKYPHAWPMTWNLVEVWEPDPPSGTEPAHWLLWTLEPAATADQALEVVRKYTCRWPIEVFFRTLKSGCRVEERRFEHVERFLPGLAIYLIVTWRTLFVCRLGREFPDISCETVFEPAEWRSVYQVVHRKAPPATAPTLAEMVRIVAQLGGYVNRRRADAPGPQTIWLGLQRVHDIALCWQLFGPGVGKAEDV